MPTLRRTKIIATLGPASQTPEVLTEMLQAGVDIVRINFSHGSHAEQQQLFETARQCARQCEREIAILADLQGPKIRITRFKEGPVVLTEGQQFIFDIKLDKNNGDETRVSLTYPELIHDVEVGDHLLLDDGKLELVINKITKHEIICDVIIGGELGNNKGINRLGGGLSAQALTDKDREDLKLAVKLGADYIALSFARSAADIELARELLQQANSNAGIIAKIERKEAIEAMDEIIEASDAIMVARGDLGVELGYVALPAIQKQLISRARELDKAVITATQMMESMIHSTIPTRAEVSDVANAVLDGTDAVMLSAETATGDYPVKTVSAMAEICLKAEEHPVAQTSRHRMNSVFDRVDEAIAMAAMYTANHLDIQAIVALTESGSTPLWMSRIRSHIPIYGLTRHISTQRKMTLYRGVYPLHFDVTLWQHHEMKREAIATLENQGVVSAGDKVILTKGDALGVHGNANALKILEVGQVY